jgi:hypothetical protein
LRKKFLMELVWFYGAEALEAMEKKLDKYKKLPFAACF